MTFSALCQQVMKNIFCFFIHFLGVSVPEEIAGFVIPPIQDEGRNTGFLGKELYSKNL